MAALAPTPTPVRAALIGVTGRMGEALLRAAPAVPRLSVTAAVASPGSLSLGRDAGEVAGVGCLHLPIITALALGAAAREARQAARDGAHREGDVGFASVRAGDIVGEHTVLFAGPGEALSLTHRATDRGIFARGALAAALWLQSQPPGRYTMRDLLGQKQ